MQKVFGFLVVLGIVLWVFLVWDREQPEKYTENIDNANKSERCLEFKRPVDDVDGAWSLGYKGRIKQLLSGCF